LEYREGDYQYGSGQYGAVQQPQLPPAGQGQHPYAAFNASGYGDDGYRDPGYQGPAAQDAGVPGTRTVSGFVEQYPGQPGYGYPQQDYGQQGYPQPGYPQSSYALPAAPQGGYVQNGYPAAGHPSGAYPVQGYGQQGYAGSSYAPAGEIEMAYPASPVAEPQPAAWDYDQPLRYEDEAPYYPAAGGYQDQNGYQNPGGYQPGYNGSEYSRPGIEGPGYDLSGIIGTSDFEAVGYDEPSYGRLSYDDPRYESPRGGQRFDQTSLDIPAFDETRLDRLWLSGDDAPGGDDSPVGYGNDGFGGESRTRSVPQDFNAFGSGGQRFDDTRFDMNIAGQLAAMDHTRFDVPAYNDTRMDNLRALAPASDLRPARGALLAPPAPATDWAAPATDWAEETSFDAFRSYEPAYDTFDGLDLAEELAPAAFTRTIDRPELDEDTATRRAVGRRRGRSSDRKQWMALGAIAVVAAGAIGGVLMKFHFSGSTGPAHSVAAPAQLDGYTRNAGLEKTTHVSALAQSVAKSSGGQASSLASAVYAQGSTMGGNEQMFMFVGGKLAGADPGASIANFKEAYPGAAQVPTGTYGGDAACTEAHIQGQKGQVAMCVWFDNDTFGALVSSTMSPAKLATTMAAARPSLELRVAQ
jgi:hypothetical protein